MASLSESFLASLELFGDVRSRLAATEFDVDQSESIKQFDDEFGRLRLWASNIGAHQKGQSSLDFRLRDASNIRDQIRRLLEDLRDTLRDVDGFLDELKSDADIDDSEGKIDEGDLESELEQICQSIVTCVDCLFQMSIIVRKPARHDFINSPLPAEILSFQGWYEGYIKDKFPNAEKEIVDRLAFAMMRRKHFLGYRERHRAKLANGLDTTDDSLSQTVASNERAVEYVDATPSEADTSTSFASTISISGDITMPPLPPKATNGKSFECPYCYVVISVKGLRSWYKHVFEDIRPYVCIVPECTTPAILFSSRRKWTRHLQDSHSKAWWHWRGHKDLQHASKFAARCLICMDEAESETQLLRHLSQHMQEVALFSLPRSEDSSDEAEATAEDEDDTSDESEGFVLRNEVQDQAPSPSLDRNNGSHNDMDERGTVEVFGKQDQLLSDPLHITAATDPYYDPDTERRLQELKDLETIEENLAAEELIVGRKMEDEELKRRSIEEDEVRTLRDSAEAEAKKQKEDAEFRARTIKTWAQAGYSEESIEKLLRVAEKKAKKAERREEEKESVEEQVLDLKNPTYIKVHRKHMDIETLETYHLPWEYDEVSFSTNIFKRLKLLAILCANSQCGS